MTIVSEPVDDEKRATIDLLHEVVARTTQAETEEEAIRACLEAICGYQGWPVGHVYLKSPDEEALLVPGKIWHLRDPERFAAFKDITEATSFRPGIGLPGRVLESAKPEWVVDVTLDPNFPRAKHAVDIGVRAGFAVPVLIDERVEAVLEFFASEALEPDLPLLRLLENAASQIGHMIKRVRSDSALREILNNSPIGISMADEDGNIEFTNSRLREILGVSADAMKQAHATDFYYQPDQRQRVLEVFRRDGVVQDMEVRLKKGDGTPIDALLTLHPVPSSKGRRFFGWIYDISERKAAEAALAASEDRFKAVLDQLPSSFSLKDDQGRYLIVNRKFQDWFAEKDADLIGKTANELYGQDFAEQVAETDRRVRETGEVFEQEVVQDFSDGNQHVTLMTKFPIDLGDGQTVAVGTVDSDITERKKAETRFKALLESAPDATVIVNADGEIVQINHQTEQLFGYTAAELMKEKVEILLPERLRKKHPAHRRAFFEDARVRPMGVGLELFGHAKDGREFPIEISLSPIETEEGALVSASVRDITERKQAEEALRESEARAKAILDTASQLQGLLKPDGTMIDANAAALSMINLSKEDVVGQPFWDCPWWTHNPDLQVRLRQAIKTAAEGETVRFLTTHPGPDGKEHVIDFRATPVTDENGEVAFIVPEGHDITDLKQAEAELREAKERAETALADLKQAQARLITTEKMASLGQLTAGIAHEIKNPLNFVNNFSETSVELLSELGEVLAPVQSSLDEDTRDDVIDIVETLKGDLQKINHHGRRADNIVKSMLLHARGDSAERVPTAVNQIVDEAFQLAYHGERARDKSFQVTMDEDLDTAAGEAELVPQDITRVLVNLLSNAFYAVKKRGQEIKDGSESFKPTVKVSTQDKGAQVEIRIRDNGIGIPKQMREKLFEPFYTTKPTGEGTGLGLSMSFDIIVHQHGGEIKVESEAGSFTEIAITLPRQGAKTKVLNS